MKFYSVVLITLLTLFSADAQEAYNWKNYTNMSGAADAAVSGDLLIGATGGGGFIFNTADSSYKTFTKTEGLVSISLTASAVDNTGRIWFGGSNGSINIYNPASGSMSSILDIFNSGKNLKSIHEMRVAGDTIFTATDFGLSLISTVNFQFLDTYLKFGSFPSNTKVYNSTFNGVLAVATEWGAAIQKPGSTNLSSPDSWNTFNRSSGLPADKVNDIEAYENGFVAATDRGLAIYRGSVWEPFLPELNNTVINSLTVYENTLYIIQGGFSVLAYSGGVLNTVYNPPGAVKKIVTGQNGELFAVSGAGLINITNGRIFAPGGPAANQFIDMAVTQDGTLYSASGKDNTGVGFYTLKDGIWNNYNVSNTPGLLSNAFYSVYTAPDNTVYLGNWGRGFARIKDGGIKSFYVDNTDLEGFQQDPTFLLTFGFGVDKQNNLWVLNYGSSNRKQLSMLTPDSVWYHFTVSPSYMEQLYELEIDSYGTKWFNSKASPKGIFYFNELNTYEDVSDDRSGLINSSRGLSNETVNAVAVDRRGDVWVGTDLGMNVISNTQSIFDSKGPQFKITSVFSLRQQAINCIAVDPLNRKWVGTNQGLLLVNTDGSQLLATYDSKNSGLLNDVIRSITVDQNSGRIYVGTDGGLTAFSTRAIMPETSFTELDMYPSPFVLNGNNNILTIDGLIRDTDIKILTISGKLVTEFTTLGGRQASWNGKDDNGNLVSSGVYLVVAYDKEGNNVITGKIAVIRN